MHAVISTKRSSKPPLSPAQKKFNKLKKKIVTLQKKKVEIDKELEGFLVFYLSKIQPLKDQVIGILEGQVEILYGHYANTSGFTKKQRARMKENMLDKMGSIFQAVPITEAKPKIREIYEDLQEKDCKEILEDDFEDFKADMQEQLEDEGLDINLEDYAMTDDPEEVLRQLAEDIIEARRDKFKKLHEFPQKAKTQQEIQRENHEQALKDLQSTEAGAVYKRLAKAIHPDLEHDPKEKEFKEALMKRLTIAYKSKDVFTLLALEMEWAQRLGEEKRNLSSNQLQIYNTMLQQQIEAIGHELQSKIFDPRYIPIRHFLASPFFDGMGSMFRAQIEVKAQIDFLQGVTQKLQSKDPMKLLNALLAPHQFIQVFSEEDF